MLRLGLVIPEGREGCCRGFNGHLTALKVISNAIRYLPLPPQPAVTASITRIYLSSVVYLRPVCPLEGYWRDTLGYSWR
jgi:hypothetical protein